MAKIENAHPKNSSGGYERLIKNEKLASLFVKAQSTVITNGTELEKIITRLSNTIADLDLFITDVKQGKIKNGSYLCTKKTLKKSSYKMEGHEPDFLIFVIQKDKVCNIVELKDGYSFDTKKSKSEYDNLQIFTNHIAPKIPFEVRFYICCFNQCDKSKIIEGLKNFFKEEQVMTGKEFCDLLGIDYGEIIVTREQDAEDNFKYVVNEMSKISEVKHAVQGAKREHIQESEFYTENDVENNTDTK